MKYGQHICENDQCGYDLAGLDYQDGQLICPECGTENSQSVFQTFPSPIMFVWFYSKPWLVGIPIGMTLAVPIGFLVRLNIGLFKLPGVLLLLVVYGAIFFRSRNRAILDVEFSCEQPSWVWNAFLIPTLIWSVVYWIMIVVVWSMIL